MISSDNIKHFEYYVNKLMAHVHAAGMAVAVIDKERNTVYENYFGYRDVGKKLPVNEDTIFGLASLTKSFTCLGLMQLKEKGKIDVEALVSRYIPAFKTERPVKVLNLMSHSGGFFPQKRILAKDVATDIGINEQDTDLAYSVAIAEEGCKRVAERLSGQSEFVGEPGEYFSYSNDGYALLSEIIRLYGGSESYAKYMMENVLKPLYMERSGCDFTYFKDDGNVSKLYYNDGETRVESDDFYNNAFALMGGGGMKSTLKDMKNYVAMYLNKGKNKSGEPVIGPAALMEMLRPGAAFGHQEYYGRGLAMSNLDDLVVYSHGGSLPGVSSRLAFSYNNEIGVIVLCNTSDVPVIEVEKAAMRLAENRNPVTPPKEYMEKAIPAERLNRMLGLYGSDEGQRVELYINDEGKLGGKVSDKVFKAVPVQRDIIILPDAFADKTIKLYENEDGSFWAIYFGSRMLKRLS